MLRLLRVGLAASFSVSLLLTFTTAVAAQDDAAAQAQAEADETAQAHFRVGRSYYDTGRFEEAAREFERAYELSHRPALLYNVFVSHRDAGNLPAATDALRAYLAAVPDAPEREQLQSRLVTMERLLAERDSDVSTPPPTPTSGGASTSASPSTSSSGGGGGGGLWVPGFIIAGVGAAAVIVSIITGVMTLDRRGQLDALCDEDGGCPPGFEATRDEAALLAGLTDGLLWGGLAVAATGVVLAFVLAEGDGGEQARVGFGPGSASLRVQF